MKSGKERPEKSHINIKIIQKSFKIIQNHPKTTKNTQKSFKKPIQKQSNYVTRTVEERVGKGRVEVVGVAEDAVRAANVRAHQKSALFALAEKTALLASTEAL